MINWSTDSLRRRDRFEYWREERSRRLYGAEIEIAAEQQLDFHGRIDTLMLGEAQVFEISSSPYAIRRSERAIAQAPQRSFAIWQGTKGAGLLQASGAEYAMKVGAIVSGHGDLPYTHLADTQRETGFRVVRMPDTLLPEPIRHLDALAPHKHPVLPGLDALFAAYLTSFFEQAPRLSGPASRESIEILVHLALAVRGVRDIRDPAGRDALRRGLLARAHGLIEGELHRDDLSPARIAAKLGISVRKLHTVFEPSGESFSRHVLARRLAKADRLLSGSPRLSVSEVAYSSGFETLSTFFRCYRAAFGASPSERRASGPADPESGPRDRI